MIDDELIERWQTAIEALPNVRRAAVLVEEVQPEERRVHVSDLMTDRCALGASKEEPRALVPASMGFAGDRPAISEGPPLAEDLSAPQTLAELLLFAAVNVPDDRIRHIQPDGAEISYSYATLLEQAELILGGLRRSGLTQGQKLILQLDRNDEILAAFWACILGGFVPVLAAVPPSYESPSNDLTRVIGVWELLDRPLILTSEPLRWSLASTPPSLWPARPGALTLAEVRTGPRDGTHHLSRPDDIAFFPLTSGSTGTPKCVALTHRSQLSRARATNVMCAHSPRDVILNWLPLDHIGSISDWHIRCLELGCETIYASKDVVLSNPTMWLDLIDRYRVTHSWAPNFAFSLILDRLSRGSTGRWDLSCVESLLSAGEAVSPHTVEQFLDRLSHYGLNRTAVRAAFGMAELGSGVTYTQPTKTNPVDFYLVDRASLADRVSIVESSHPDCVAIASVGTPIPGVSLRIVNQRGAVSSEGEVGRLQVKGPPVASGYYANDRATAEAFLPDGWFDTGDLGFIGQGRLFLTGRGQDGIVIHGANYSNSEIEAVVEKVEGVEPSYTAACAVRIPGAHTDRLAIFLTTRDRRSVDVRALLQRVRGRVAREIGVRPDYLIPVAREAIPKTAIGKIQRSALARRFEAGEFEAIVKEMDRILGGPDTLPNWFYVKEWIQRKADPLGELPDGTVLVFQDRWGLGEAVVRILEEQSRACISVDSGAEFIKLAADRFVIDPASPSHYERLFAEPALSRGPIAAIVHCWTYGGQAATTHHPEQVERALTQGIYSVASLARALSHVADSRPVRLVVVGSNTRFVLADDDVRPESATLIGLLKCLPREIPWLSCRHVDIQAGSPAEMANYVVDELMPLDKEGEVAYRNGRRLVPRIRQSDRLGLGDGASPFRQGGVYLLSGGLGGIGAEVARFLLQNYHAHLLIIGRTELPCEDTDPTGRPTDGPSERAQILAQLKELEGTVDYAAIDVCDLESLTRFVAEAATSLGRPIDAVLHLAGMARECAVVDEVPEELAATLRPKVFGALCLHEIAKRGPGTSFISFSSVSSFFGGARLGAYASANIFLEEFAAFQNAAGVPSFCVHWTFWHGLGMSRESAADAIARLRGYHSLRARDALISLEAVLNAAPGTTFIGLDGSHRNIRRYENVQCNPTHRMVGYADLSLEDAKAAPLAEIPDRYGTSTDCHLESVDNIPVTQAGQINLVKLRALVGQENAPVAPETDAERRLQEIWAEILEIDNPSVEADFFDLGGDSLQSVQLFAQLEKVFGKELALDTLFKASTIRELAAVIDTAADGDSLDSLVLLRPTGTMAPLFLVHDVDGDALQYRTLAHLLDDNRPVYGLRPYGEPGYRTLHTRIPQMVDYYIARMRKARPEGPYLVGGLCSGGLLAFEIARTLQSQGEDVPFVALLDSVEFAAARPSLAKARWRRLTDDLVRRRQRKGVSWVAEAGLVLRKMRNVTIYEARSLLDRMVGWSKALVLDVHSQRGTKPPRFLASVPLRVAFSFAEKRYRPAGKYKGRLTLFRASGPHSEDVLDQDVPAALTTSDPLLGWSDRATLGVSVHDVPGGHTSMLQSPNVGELARTINECLAQIDETLAAGPGSESRTPS